MSLSKNIKLRLLIVIFTLIPLYSPTVSSALENSIYLNDEGACLNSLESVWKEFGTPYPCFSEGSNISLRAPNNNASKGKSSVQIVTNGKQSQISSTENVIKLANYKLGLNEVYFATIGKSGEIDVIGNVYQFIIYKTTLRTGRSLTNKISYTVILDPRVDASKVLTPEMNPKLIEIGVEDANQQAVSTFKANVFTVDLDSNEKSEIEKTKSVVSTFPTKILIMIPIFISVVVLIVRPSYI